MKLFTLKPDGKEFGTTLKQRNAQSRPRKESSHLERKKNTTIKIMRSVYDFRVE